MRGPLADSRIDPVLDSPLMAYLRGFHSACIVGALIAAVLSGCMVGPDYERPEMVNPDSWHTKLMDDMKLTKDGAGRWWESFNDPVLVELINRTERNNLDLRTMIARIEKARAEYGIAGSYLWPQIDANGRAVWYRADGGVSPVPGVFDPTGETYSTTLDMTWEIDLWGRIRRMTQSAEMDMLAAIENWRDALVTIRAEVASTYIDYRTSRAQADLLQLAVIAAQIAVQLSEEEYHAGTAPLTDLLYARSQLLNFQAQLPEFESSAARSLNQLSVLMGEAPGYLGELVDDAGEIPVPSSEIAVGIPADVIRQRPDIRAAERQLAAEVATIGATEAQLFPQLTLMGGVGFESSQASQLFVWSNRNWSIGPSFSWSLLNWGRIGAQIDAQKATTQEALISYQGAVLGAYQEVENALVNFASYEVGRQNTAASRDDTLQTLVLELQAYEVGTVDMSSVVQIELDYLDSESSLLNFQGQVAQAAVSIYKATGGDWSPVLPGENGPIPIPKDTKAVASAGDGESS